MEIPFNIADFWPGIWELGFAPSRRPPIEVLELMMPLAVRLVLIAWGIIASAVVAAWHTFSSAPWMSFLIFAPVFVVLAMGVTFFEYGFGVQNTKSEIGTGNIEFGKYKAAWKGFAHGCMVAAIACIVAAAVLAYNSGFRPGFATADVRNNPQGGVDFSAFIRCKLHGDKDRDCTLFPTK